MRTLLVFLALTVQPLLLCAPSRAAQRTIIMHYKASIKDVPAGVKQIDLWLPLPAVNQFQSLKDKQSEPRSAKVSSDSFGNKILHVRFQPKCKQAPFAEFSCAVTRQEQAGMRALKNEVNLFNLFIKSDSLVPIDENVQDEALAIVDKSSATTNTQKARAIYDYVVSTMKYDKSGYGWGRGDLHYACTAHKGNCTDFHAMFVGFCRAVGVPARFIVGFQVPARRGAGSLTGYHCWAEFFDATDGWVPVDASEASKHPDLREYYFGHLDENRVAFTTGRDLTLVPAQAGKALNFFIYPYAEADGTEVRVEHEVTFQ